MLLGQAPRAALALQPPRQQRDCAPALTGRGDFRLRASMPTRQPCCSAPRQTQCGAIAPQVQLRAGASSGHRSPSGVSPVSPADRAPQRRRRRNGASAAASTGPADASDSSAAGLSSSGAAEADVAEGGKDGAGEQLPMGAVADVEELRGVRVNVDDNQLPLVEYLVHWKGGAPDSWESSANIAENLLQDYEDRWRTACRQGDEAAIKLMLGSGRRVLSQSVDKERRSALHFAAATGNARIIRILCEAGSEVDLMDKDGYTPLHMAAGYLHTPAVELLLAYGANPEIRDREARSVVDLVERLKDQLPPDAQQAQRKFALEQCSDILTGTLYDELDPLQLLDSRQNEDGSTDFLVQWPDDSPDSWVNQAQVAEDLQEDFQEGLEWAEAAEVLRVVVRGDARQYLVRWADSGQYPDSWELEEHLSPSLIAAWEAAQPKDGSGMAVSAALSKKAVGGEGRGSKRGPKKRRAKKAGGSAHNVSGDVYSSFDGNGNGSSGDRNTDGT